MMTLEDKIALMNKETEEEMERRGDVLQPSRTVYTVDEIQDILQIGRCAAYELAKSGKFRTIRLGKSIRIIRQSFDDWLDGEATSKEV